MFRNQNHVGHRLRYFCEDARVHRIVGAAVGIDVKQRGSPPGVRILDLCDQYACRIRGIHLTCTRKIGSHLQNLRTHANAYLQPRVGKGLEVSIGDGLHLGRKQCKLSGITGVRGISWKLLPFDVPGMMPAHSSISELKRC